MIKNKTDIYNLISFVKESNNVLSYEKGTEEIIIKYNKHNDNFDIARLNNNIKSTGYILESTLIHQLWFDRKYINTRRAITC